jgi:hypothetical protein
LKEEKTYFVIVLFVVSAAALNFDFIFFRYEKCQTFEVPLKKVCQVQMGKEIETKTILIL